MRLTTRDDIGRARPVEELKGYFLTTILEKLARYEELDEDIKNTNVPTTDLNKVSQDLNKVKTRGDAIRESNENLAEFIATITGNCMMGNCLGCELMDYCDDTDGLINKNMVRFLNKSVESEE